MLLLNIQAMKGKSNFSQEEYQKIKQLVTKKVDAPRDKQKGIRASMRRLDFYITDFVTDQKGFDVSQLEQLVTQKKITIEGETLKMKKSISTDYSSKKIVAQITESKEHQKNIEDEFRLFMPTINSINDIPNSPGNYIVCLKKGCGLPKNSEVYQTKKFNGYEVIYTGIAGKSLRNRDYKQHFTGNAGSSTLRKSIGSIMGLKKIPRDSNPANGKTKFTEHDEDKLSIWMQENLLLYFKKNPLPKNLEDELIKKFNPPLNLSKNKNRINAEFRKKLSELRSEK